MKKIFTVLLAVVLLSAMLIPASAATEEELLEEFKKISISRHLLTEVENLAATYDVTPEQGEKLMPLLKRAITLYEPCDTDSLDASRIYKLRKVLGTINSIAMAKKQNVKSIISLSLQLQGTE
jgi:hypothetical protein